VLSVAGVLFAVEFLADKVPIVDSVWDAIHTVIRPVGGALLASHAPGDLSPVAEVLMFLLLGGATLATHAAKATTRLAVNASPEPVSNVAVSPGVCPSNGSEPVVGGSQTMVDPEPNVRLSFHPADLHTG